MAELQPPDPAASVSLLLSSHRSVRVFGALTLLSFHITYVFYETWLVSVRCYFAAMLSAVVVAHVKRATWTARARHG